MQSLTLQNIFSPLRVLLWQFKLLFVGAISTLVPMMSCYFNVRQCTGSRRRPKAEKVLYGIKADVCHFALNHTITGLEPPLAMLFVLEVLDKACFAKLTNEESSIIWRTQSQSSI